MSQLSDATPADRHRLLAQHFLDLIDGVEDWDAPTPVKEWRALDVVEHLRWLPGMLASMDVDLDIPHADSPIEQFKAQTVRVQEVLDGPEGSNEVQSRMFGTMPLAQVIDQFYTFDLYAHGWDLAKATGQQSLVDADYAEGAFQGMSAMGSALHASGQFGTPQPVADDASAQERLIALIGRDPAWGGISRPPA